MIAEKMISIFWRIYTFWTPMNMKTCFFKYCRCAPYQCLKCWTRFSYSVLKSSFCYRSMPGKCGDSRYKTWVPFNGPPKNKIVMFKITAQTCLIKFLYSGDHVHKVPRSLLQVKKKRVGLWHRKVNALCLHINLLINCIIKIYKNFPQPKIMTVHLIQRCDL